MTAHVHASSPDLLVEALVTGSSRFQKLLAVEHSVFVIQVVLHLPDKDRDSPTVGIFFNTGKTRHYEKQRNGKKGTLESPVLQQDRSGCRDAPCGCAWWWSSFGLRAQLSLQPE